jgi:signal transduction histidine kinase
VPEPRRTPLGLVPAPSPSDTVASESYAADSFARGADSFARGVVAATSISSVAPIDIRESSPPEGTLMRSSSSSQVIPKASPATDLASDEPTAPGIGAGGIGAAGIGAASERSASKAASGLAPLVSSVTHDLNNLLQIISTTTQLLRLHETNKDAQAFLADIASATDRAARLSGQLLEAARQERRRQSEADCD